MLAEVLTLPARKALHTWAPRGQEAQGEQGSVAPYAMPPLAFGWAGQAEAAGRHTVAGPWPEGRRASWGRRRRSRCRQTQAPTPPVWPRDKDQGPDSSGCLSVQLP